MSKDNKDRPDEMNDASEARAAAAGRPRKLDRSVQTAIGARLRAYYDGVEREAIPDRFVELLKQLEKKDPDGDKGA
jgi:hypothetical protein